MSQVEKVAMSEPVRAVDDIPRRPDTEMWVLRFQRDGYPREVHVRRGDHTRASVRSLARGIAKDVGGVVWFTMADIGATYAWRLIDEELQPVWYAVEPRGARGPGRVVVEACPNGCTGGQR